MGDRRGRVPARRRRLPGCARRGRLLGGGRREVPRHPVRPLPFRRAMAPAAGHAADHLHARDQLHARLLDTLAGADLGGVTGGLLRAHGWRRVRSVQRAHRAMGWPAAHPHARGALAVPGLPARRAGRPGPAREAARDSHHQRALRRARARRATDLGAVHGLVHVSAVRAARRHRGRAGARGRGPHAVHRGLHGRDGAWWPAGRAQGSVRSGRLAGPGLLADAETHRAAAGAVHGGPQHHEHLHLPVQGHLAGHHRLALRTHRRTRAGTELRRPVAPVQARGVLLHHPHLFHRLLRHVALQPVGGKTACRQQGALKAQHA